ncbi:MAG: hypothetical protein IJC25_01740 [Clostridia bacterium]|nr:hypothetical protein [Clostridia bacterium]
MNKMLVYNVTPINTDVTDLAKFERKVKRAAELGATHVLITEIPKSRWIWEADLSDPYPNWGMLNSSLFKIVVPKELEQWLPTDYAAANLELIRQRSAILRKYGLKASAYFCEPFYLPEAVYRAHPDWRGPRCDHPRRAKNYYYSPCMDNPEVLAMYRDAMRQLCEVADIDYVYLHTNDSGGGICWSSGLYAGPNGPEHCKHISLADRILGYFRVFRQGAADAGRSICIETNSNIGVKEDEHTMDAIWPLLEDGMAVNFKTNKGTPLSSLVDINWFETIQPVRNIPMLFTYLELLQKAHESSSTVKRITLIDDDFDEYARIIELFNKKPTKTLADRVNLLTKLATEIAGKSAANLLVEAWQQTDASLRHFFDTCIEGFSWVTVNERLLNRPFVMFPDELTEDEKGYYRPYLFQAVDETQAQDLLNNQCTSFVRGTYAVWIASRAMMKAMKCWENAMVNYRAAADKQTDAAVREQLLLAADRYELCICVGQNYVNAMKFQDLIDNIDFDYEPAISPQWPQAGDAELLEFERLTRAEIDNTYHVIRLIKNREREMLLLAPTAEQEDIFWLSPEITSQLYKKAEIMLDHQLDGKRVLETPNK